MRIRSLHDIVFGTLKEATNDEAANDNDMRGLAFNEFLLEFLEIAKPLHGSFFGDGLVFSRMFFDAQHKHSNIYANAFNIDQRIIELLVGNKLSTKNPFLPDDLERRLYQIFRQLKIGENRVDEWLKAFSDTIKLWDAGLSFSIDKLKNVKPEVPEDQIDAAGMGRYAFAPRRRKHVPSEPNTELENDMYVSLSDHVEINKPMSDTKIGAAGFKNMLKHGWYDGVINEPQTEYVFRGMALSRNELIGLGVTINQLNDKNNKAALVKATYKPLTTGQSSSWSDTMSSARKFAQERGVGKPYLVIAVAKIADNHNSFMSGKNGFYNITGLEEFSFEKEVIGLGNIKVSKIYWQYINVNDKDHDINFSGKTDEN